MRSWSARARTRRFAQPGGLARAQPRLPSTTRPWPPGSRAKERDPQAPVAPKWGADKLVPIALTASDAIPLLFAAGAGLVTYGLLAEQQRRARSRRLATFIGAPLGASTASQTATRIAL